MKNYHAKKLFCSVYHINQGEIKYFLQDRIEKQKKKIGREKTGTAQGMILPVPGS
jgi:hypothetical protein